MIRAQDSEQVQAALLATRAAGRDLRRTIYAEARQQLGGEWKPALERRATRRRDARVIMAGARVTVGTDGFRVQAATSRRKFRNGLVPADDWPAVEFGARNVLARYRRRNRRSGGEHIVNRTINRQFPGRVKQGRIAFDASSELGTRLVAVWVRSIVDVYRKAAGEE